MVTDLCSNTGHFKILYHIKMENIIKLFNNDPPGPTFDVAARLLLEDIDIVQVSIQFSRRTIMSCIVSALISEFGRLLRICSKYLKIQCPICLLLVYNGTVKS